MGLQLCSGSLAKPWAVDQHSTEDLGEASLKLELAATRSPSPALDKTLQSFSLLEFCARPVVLHVL